jgi:hypothetical protein
MRAYGIVSRTCGRDLTRVKDGQCFKPNRLLRFTHKSKHKIMSLGRVEDFPTLAAYLCWDMLDEEPASMVFLHT